MKNIVFAVICFILTGCMAAGTIREVSINGFAANSEEIKEGSKFFILENSN